jgi:cytosine permease
VSNEFPREPVPETSANRPAWAISLIVGNAIMGVPVMILGASLGADYGWADTWWVIGLGCAITAAFAALSAYAGVKSRRSAALLAQHAFGASGARFLNVAIAIALLGWFAVEMGFVGAMLADSSRSVLSVEIGRAPGIVGASVLVCAITMAGITLISRAPRVFLPLLGMLLFAVIALTRQHAPPVRTDAALVESMGSGISAIVGAYIVGCLIMPDYSRFVRSPNAAVGATLVALGPIYALALGTYAAAGLAVNQAQPSGILLALGLPGFISLLLPIGLLQNGIMCLYSSALATSTFIRAFSFRAIVAATMLIGMSLALAGADSLFVGLLVVLGIVFPPAVALLIGAGLSAQPHANADGRHWNGAGLALWAIGIACGASSQWLGWGLTGFSAFDGFIGSAVGIPIMSWRSPTRR